MRRQESAPFRYWLLACGGSLLIGVVVPCWLLLIHLNFQLDFGKFSRNAQAAPVAHHDYISEILWFNSVALLLAGPGTLILSMALFGYLSRNLSPDVGHQLFRGIYMGALLWFFNLPAYAAGFCMGKDQSLVLVRMIMLFAISGTTCGAWCAWQGWRSCHNDAPFLPRYSLKTLLYAVLAWGLLLALFKPEAN